MPIPNVASLKEAFEAKAAVARAMEMKQCQEGPEQMDTPNMVYGGWTSLLNRIHRNHAERVVQELGPNTMLEPIYPDQSVQKAFLNACRSFRHTLTVTYHGTKACNIPSISNRGLLIPGHDDIKVVHGSAHGVGIYTAHIGSASLSKGFCDSDTMIVCAVCDTSIPTSVPECPIPKPTPSPPLFVPSMTYIQTRFPKRTAPPATAALRMGSFQVKQKSDEICHVGNAVVVYEKRFVVPVFIATSHASPQLQQQIWEEPEEIPWEWPQQIGRRRIVTPLDGQDLVQFGSESCGRTGKTVWLPAMPQLGTTGHERSVKRRLQRKSRQCHRWNARKEKFSNAG